MAPLWAICAELVLWTLWAPIPTGFLHYRRCPQDQPRGSVSYYQIINPKLKTIFPSCTGNL